MFVYYTLYQNNRDVYFNIFDYDEHRHPWKRLMIDFQFDFPTIEQAECAAFNNCIKNCMID